MLINHYNYYKIELLAIFNQIFSHCRRLKYSKFCIRKKNQVNMLEYFIVIHMSDRDRKIKYLNCFPGTYENIFKSRHFRIVDFVH